MDNMTAHEVETISQFLADAGESSKAEGLSEETANKIKALLDRYKKTTMECSDVIVCVNCGFFGSIEVKHIVDVNSSPELNYTERKYVNLAVNPTTITIYTDFSTTEPFNRQGSFYIGTSFSQLELIKATVDYREFKYMREFKSSECFGISPFSYNPYYKTVDFDICIAKESAHEFICELKNLLGK